MPLRAIILLSIASMVCTVQGQRAQSNPDLNRLTARAAEFWRLAEKGERVKASSYVLPSKREEYLNGSSIPMVAPKVIGFLFTDKPTRVNVQIAIGSLATLGGDSGQQITQQTWMWTTNDWFLDLEPATNPFGRGIRVDASRSAASVKYLEQHFTLKTRKISLGTLWEDESRWFPVDFEYTGDSPIRIETDPKFPFVSFDVVASQNIRPGSRTVNLGVDPAKFEGRLALALPLNVYYQDVVMRTTLDIDGVFVHPVTPRQVPEVLQNQSKDPFEIVLKNNLDEPIRISEVSATAKIKVIAQTAAIPPHTEAVFRFGLESTAADVNEPIHFKLVIPSRGLRQIAVPLRIQEPQ